MAIAQECYRLYWTSPGSNIPQSSSCTDTYHPSQKPSKLDKQNMQNRAGEVRMNSYMMYSSGPPHMDEQGLVDQLELIYIHRAAANFKEDPCQKLTAVR